MSENSTESGEPNGDTGTNADTPEVTVETLQAQIEDLKKHSRKWEDRAKENYDARKELDKVRESQLSDEEKRSKAQEAAEKRAADAEARAAEMERTALRYRIAAKFQMSDEDAELFLTGSDEDLMTKQAERFSSRSSGPRPNKAQGTRTGSGASTPADALGDFFDSL